MCEHGALYRLVCVHGSHCAKRIPTLLLSLNSTTLIVRFTFNSSWHWLDHGDIQIWTKISWLTSATAGGIKSCYSNKLFEERTWLSIPHGKSVKHMVCVFALRNFRFPWAVCFKYKMNWIRKLFESRVRISRRIKF